jgi:hypothetical protein
MWRAQAGVEWFNRDEIRHPCESGDRCRVAQVSVIDTNLMRKQQLGGVAGSARAARCRAIDTLANQCLLSSMTRLIRTNPT